MLWLNARRTIAQSYDLCDTCHRPPPPPFAPVLLGLHVWQHQRVDSVLLVELPSPLHEVESTTCPICAVVFVFIVFVG